MAIQKELDLNQKYKKLIDVEVQKNQIQTPTITQPTTPTIKSGFGVYGVPSTAPISAPKIQPLKVSAEPLKPIAPTPVQPSAQQPLKPVQAQPFQTKIQPYQSNIVSKPIDYEKPAKDLQYFSESMSIKIPEMLNNLTNIPKSIEVSVATANNIVGSTVVNGIASLLGLQDKEILSKSLAGEVRSPITLESQYQDYLAKAEDLKKDNAYFAEKTQEVMQKYQKEDVSEVAKIGTDLTSVILDMAPSIAANYIIPGSGRFAMSTTILPRTIGSALNMEMNLGQSVSYAGIMAGMEYFIEGIGEGVLGQSKFGQAVEKSIKSRLPGVVKSVIETYPETGKLLKYIYDINSEGFEEVMSSIGGYFVNKVYGIENRTGQQLATETMRDYYMGVLSAVALGAQQTVINKTMESIANASVVQNLNINEAKRIATKIGNQVLNYDVQFITQAQAEDIAETLKANKENFKASTASILHEYKNVDGQERLGTIYMIEGETESNPLITSFFHEVSHALEVTGQYKNLIAEVQASMGEEFTRATESIARDIYRKNKDAIVKRSGVKVGESEFVAEYIIQRMLFGKGAGMRVSYIRKLAQENPRLFERISDIVNTISQRMIRSSLDPENVNDMAFMESMNYIDNLKNIYQSAFQEFSEMKGTLLEQAQAKMMGAQGVEVQAQVRPYESVMANINTESYAQTEDAESNALHFDNYLNGLALKNITPSIKFTFGLSNDDMNTIFETLKFMTDESANDNQTIMSAVKNSLNGKIDGWFTNITQLKNTQLSEFLIFLKNAHGFMSNGQKIQAIGAPITSTQNWFGATIDENSSPKELRAFKALKQLQDAKTNGIARLIGVETGLEKNLVVLHNLSSDKLEKSLRLGGFAMPSLAVTKADYPHANFGDITVVFNKGVLNGSPTFASDAYTPRFPNTFFAITEDAQIEKLRKDSQRFSEVDGVQSLDYFIYANLSADTSSLESSIRRIALSDLGAVIFNEVRNQNAEIKSINTMMTEFHNQVEGALGYQAILETEKQRSLAVLDYLKSFGAKEYMRNTQDMFTASGSRRKPKYLYTELTLENVIKLMNSNAELVGSEDEFSFSDIRRKKALLNTIMKSAEEVANNRNLIEKRKDFMGIMVTQNDLIENALTEIDDNNSDYFDVNSEKYQANKDIVNLNKRVKVSPAYVLDTFLEKRKSITPEAIEKEFISYGLYSVLDMSSENPGMKMSEVISKALEVVKSMTVDYFETKPTRAVEFSEIEHIILPKTANQSIKDALQEFRIPFTEYEYDGDESVAQGRLPIINSHTEWQFQLVSDFDKDSEGKELTVEQQKFFLDSKVVGKDKTLLLAQKQGIIGYYNIVNPFDSTKRANFEAIEAYNYESADQITIQENGFLNEDDAYKLLGYLNLNGYGFDGINFDNNGKEDFIALTMNQFKPAEDIAPVFTHEPQFQYRELINQFDSKLVRSVPGVLIDDFSFDVLTHSIRTKDKAQTMELLNKEYDYYLKLSNKYGTSYSYTGAFKYLDIAKTFVEEFDTQLDHDSSGNIVSVAQKEFFKDSYLKINGDLMTVFHGTRGEFNQFDYSRVNTNGFMMGLGIYTTPNIMTSLGYAGPNAENLKELYANIKNPMIHEKSKLSLDRFKQFFENTKTVLKAYADEFRNSSAVQVVKAVELDYYDESNMYKDIVQERIDEYILNFEENFDVESTYDEFNGIASNLKHTMDSRVMEIMRDDLRINGKYIEQYLQGFIDTTGYDGYFSESQTVVVGFLPSQFKDIRNRQPKNTNLLMEEPEMQMQMVSKSSTGEDLTEGQKAFFASVAPIMVNGNNKLKAFYHGSNYLFTTPLVDKSKGYYKFGENNVMFFTNNIQMAGTYARGEKDIIDFKSKTPSGNIYKGFVRAERPIIIDGLKQDWIDIPTAKDNSALNTYSEEARKNYEQVYAVFKPKDIIDPQTMAEEYQTASDAITTFGDEYIALMNKAGVGDNVVLKKNLETTQNRFMDILNEFKNDTDLSKTKSGQFSNLSYTLTNFYKTGLYSIKNSKGFNQVGLSLLEMEDAKTLNQELDYAYSKFRNALTRISEFAYMAQNNKLYGYNATTTTDELVRTILNLKNKGLITTDSIYIQNIKDIGQFRSGERVNYSDVLITLENGQFKDYQNENPSTDSDINFQLMASNNYIDALTKNIQRYRRDNQIYSSRESVQAWNYRDNFWFNNFLDEKRRNGEVVTAQKIKDTYIAEYRNQNDEIKRNAIAYRRSTTLLVEENKKLDIMNRIVKDIEYTDIQSSKSTSSVYLTINADQFDALVERFGMKTIILNPNIGDTFTLRISDHDRTSEGFDVPDMAIDIRDFGYIRSTLAYNLDDSEESDNQGNALSIGQAKRFANSTARTASGNLQVYHMAYPSQGSAIIGAGRKFSTSLEFMQKQAEALQETTGTKAQTHDFYLDIRKPFDTKSDPDALRIFNEQFLGKFSYSNAPVNESGYPSAVHGTELKDFLINNGYGYDSIILDEGNDITSLLTLKDGIAKTTDNKNPSVAPTSLPIRPDESFSIQHSLFSDALTEDEKQELSVLKSMDESFGILENDTDFKRFQELLEKEKQVIKHGDLMNLMSWNDAFKKVYAKAKKKHESLPMNPIIERMLDTVKGYGGTNRRTVDQWKYIARNFGMDYKPTSQLDLINQALYAWFHLAPNQKQNLNRQGKKYVAFKVNDFVNEVLKGANVGTVVMRDSVVESVNPQITAEVQQGPVIIQENYEDYAPYYPMDDSMVPPETEAYYIPSQDDLNDFFTEVYVKDVISKPVLENDVIRTRKHPRTIIASGNVSDAVIGEVENDIESGLFNYSAVSDKSALDYAQKAIEGSLEEQKITLIQNYENGLALSKNDIAIGELLVVEFSKAKDTKSVSEILAVLAGAGTEMGQAIQAMQLINKLTGYGQALVLEKVVKRINSEFKKNNRIIDGKLVEIKIDENLKQELIQQTDMKDVKRVVEQIKLNLASQIPPTLYEKLNAWRYFSMLGNIATHVRNLMGNIAMVPMRVTRDAMSSALQMTLTKEQRDRNLLYFFDKNLRSFARADFELVKDEITSSGKYDLRSDIEQRKTVFKTKALERLMNLNFDYLEKEDIIFMRSAYVASLGQYMKAKGLTPETITEKQLAQARTHAFQEAKKATYRSASALAKALNQLSASSRQAEFVMGAVMPFVKTPLNILKTGFEYSPVGLIYNIPKAFYGLAKGESPTKIIDSITAGMTGTMIASLGAFLFGMGILNVGEDDEDPYKKLVYERSLGFQRYSLKFAGGTYSLDWLAPAIVPLIMGAELAKSLEEDGQGDSFFNYAPDIMLSVFDPLFEMSMLKGIFDLTDSFSQSLAGQAGEAITTAVTNYVSQYLPTFVAQIGRTFDDYQRSTYAPKDSTMNPLIERSLRQLANKVPFLAQYVNAPSIDIMGNPIERPSNLFARVLLNFVSPGSYKPATATATDREIVRLYEATKNSNIIPDVAPKKFTYNGTDYIFDNKEYSDFAQKMGQGQYDIIEQLMNSKDYVRLSMDDKVKVAESVYKYAYTKSKAEYLNAKGIGFTDAWYGNINNARSGNISTVEYLLVKQVFDTMKSDTLTTKKQKFIDYLNSTGRGLKVNAYLKYVGGYEVDSFGLLEGLK